MNIVRNKLIVGFLILVSMLGMQSAQCMPSCGFNADSGFSLPSGRSVLWSAAAVVGAYGAYKLARVINNARKKVVCFKNGTADWQSYYQAQYPLYLRVDQPITTHELKNAMREITKTSVAGLDYERATFRVKFNTLASIVWGSVLSANYRQEFDKLEAIKEFSRSYPDITIEIEVSSSLCQQMKDAKYFN